MMKKPDFLHVDTDSWKCSLKDIGMPWSKIGVAILVSWSKMGVAILVSGL